MKNKGITLISLIITIIVLLILTAVSMNILFGDDGILSQSRNSSKKTKLASVAEDLQLAWSARLTKYYEDIAKGKNVSIEDYLTIDELNVLLKQSGKIKEMKTNGVGNYIITYEKDGEAYEVVMDKRGTVISNNFAGETTNFENSGESYSSIGKTERQIYEHYVSKAPGIYDLNEGNLVYSWQELIDNEIVTIDETDKDLTYYDYFDEEDDSQNQEKIRGILVISNEVKIITQVSGYFDHLVIPNTVESMGIFQLDSDNLKGIVIPTSVINLEDSNAASEEECDFSTIEVLEGNPKYDSRNNCNAIIDKNYLLNEGDSEEEQVYVNMLIKGCKNTRIPNDIYGISSCAFVGCKGLKEIVIPSNIVEIESNPFENSGLTTISVADENETYDSRDNCNAIIETNTNSLIIGTSLTIIPNTVEKIDDFAFSSCENLSSIEIPESVTEIGACAFSVCPKLTSITLPDSIETICEGAFDSYMKTIIYKGVTYSEPSVLNQKLIADGIADEGENVWSETDSND